MTKVICFASGKGGVGKTTISSNLAYEISKSNKSVLLFDADLGLANAQIALGIKPKFSFNDFLSGEKSLNDILVKINSNFNLLPGASGVKKLSSLSDIEVSGIINSFNEISTNLDYLLIDSAAGISNSVITFLGASQFKILILKDDPSSMADVYATIKVLNQDKLTTNIYIIVNSVEKNRGIFIFKQLQSITKKFLNVELNFLGSIQYDEMFSMLTRSGKPVCPISKNNQSHSDFVHLAEKIIKLPSENEITGGVQFFLQSLISRKSA